MPNDNAKKPQKPEKPDKAEPMPVKRQDRSNEEQPQPRKPEEVKPPRDPGIAETE